MVSEAFLPFFVRTVGHYASYVKKGGPGKPGVFEKRSFYKAIESKTTRHFVKKFIQTQMFDLFIQEVEQQQPGPQQGEAWQHFTHTHRGSQQAQYQRRCVTSATSRLRFRCKTSGRQSEQAQEFTERRDSSLP